jgi:hypothetical protein
MVALRLA